METEMQIIIFKLASVYIGVEADKIKRIVPAKDIKKGSSSPGRQENFVILNNDFVPVCDLYGMFLTESLDAKKTALFVILGKNEKALGFLVDGSESICRLSQNELHSPPAAIHEKNISFKMVASINEKLVWILDTEWLFQKELQENKDW